MRDGGSLDEMGARIEGKHLPKSCKNFLPSWQVGPKRDSKTQQINGLPNTASPELIGNGNAAYPSRSMVLRRREDGIKPE